MLKQMNWDENKGLGAEAQGRLDPVKTTWKTDRRGLGSQVTPPPRVTHFAAGEAAKTRIKLKKPKMTKARRKTIEKLKKEQEESIRNELYK